MKRKDCFARKFFFALTVWAILLTGVMAAWGDLLFRHETTLTSETTFLNEDGTPRETWKYVYVNDELVSSELIWSAEWEQAS